MTDNRRKRLTKRQRQVLGWIEEFIDEHGMPPTVREIGAHYGIASSSVFDHLKALERKGCLRRGNLGARSLIIEGRRSEGAANADAVVVPVMGRIAAGVPDYAVEEPSETITVEKRLARGRELYALRVEGDSMMDAGILDGDLVIIRKQDTADNGDIVVALIKDESTLKRFYRKQDHVRLEPANHAREPIRVRTDEFRIQGKVIGVQRIFGEGEHPPVTRKE